MIAIIDYGVGNLFSLSSSLTYLGLAHKITNNPAELAAADRLILPGVGAFGDAAAKLAQGGRADEIKRMAKDGKPLLGICLGMQLLFDKSYEFGEHKGLGLISGTVEALKDDLPCGLKVPHIGWNSLRLKPDEPLFKYCRQGDYVYFVHSFWAKNCAADIVAVADYGIPVTAAVRRGNVVGMQFHPEKSGQVGLSLLKAWAEL